MIRLSLRPKRFDSMNLRVLVTGLLLTMLVACQSGDRDPVASDEYVLTVIGTNDIHGAVAASEGRGGLPMLAAYVNALRAKREQDGGALLLIDAGDMWQGTLESNLGEGSEIVAAFNTMGYAAAAIGNHEFDFGPVGPEDKPLAASDDPRGALKARAAEARFPLLAANLIDDATSRPVDWPNVMPSVILEVAGIKVGVIGVVTKDAFVTTLAANTGGLTIAPLAEAIIEHAVQLREQGATLIIVAAHAGGRCWEFADPNDLSSCEPTAEIFATAREIPQGLVDHIVAGHVHAGLAHEVNGITITSAYTRAAAFGRVDFLIDRDDGTWTARHVFAPHEVCERQAAVDGACVAAGTAQSATPVFAGASLTADPAVVEALQPAFERALQVKEEALGISLRSPIRLHVNDRSPLGNLFADGLLAAVPEADIAIHNSRGGLRADLPEGELNFGHVYEVFPFSNRVVSFELSVPELRRVFARQLLREHGVQISFAGLTVQTRCEEAGMKIEFFRPSGERLAEADRVVIASNDFLATGGDGIFAPVIPAEGLAHNSDGPLMRDVVIEYLGRLTSPLDESLFVDTRNARLQSDSSLPLACSFNGDSAASR